MRQTPSQLHHRAANLIPNRHMALMVMYRRCGAAMSAEMHAACMMAVFDTGTMVAAGSGILNIGWAPAEARHECWACRCSGVGGGSAVAVSVTHLEVCVCGLMGLCMCVFVFLECAFIAL
jgi:hypothetical protein